MARRNETIATPDPTKSPDVSNEAQSLIDSGKAIPILGGTQIQFTEDVDTPALDKFRGVTQTTEAINGMFNGFEGLVASSSFPQDRIDLINTAEEKRRAMERSRIEGAAEEEKGRILETGRAATGGIEAQTRISGGAGTSGLGASTIRESMIQLEQKRIDDSIRKLNKQKEDALAAADYESFDRANKAIREEEDRYYKLRQQQFDNTLALAKFQQEQGKTEFDQNLALEKLGLDVKKFEAGEERANRTQELAEAKFNYDVTQDEIDRMNDNLLDMAKGGISLDQISEEDRTAFEKMTGMVPGTFEAIYQRMLDDSQRGIEIDMLKLDQLKTSIARTRQLMANTGTTTANKEQMQQALAAARAELDKSRGEDTKIDPYLYEKLRADFAEVFGAESVSDFDNTFAISLSPQERARLGVGKAAGIKATEGEEGDLFE